MDVSILSAHFFPIVHDDYRALHDNFWEIIPQGYIEMKGSYFWNFIEVSANGGGATNGDISI